MPSLSILVIDVIRIDIRDKPDAMWSVGPIAGNTVELIWCSTWMNTFVSFRQFSLNQTRRIIILIILLTGYTLNLSFPPLNKCNGVTHNTSKLYNIDKRCFSHIESLSHYVSYSTKMYINHSDAGAELFMIAVDALVLCITGLLSVTRNDYLRNRSLGEWYKL